MVESSRECLSKKIAEKMRTKSLYCYCIGVYINLFLAIEIKVAGKQVVDRTHVINVRLNGRKSFSSNCDKNSKWFSYKPKDQKERSVFYATFRKNDEH